MTLARQAFTRDAWGNDEATCLAKPFDGTERHVGEVTEKPTGLADASSNLRPL